MSLFPAYAANASNEVLPAAAEESSLTARNQYQNEVDDICVPIELDANSEEEATLLETSSDGSTYGENDSSKRKRKLDIDSDEPVKKKKKKHKEKRKEKKGEKKAIDENSDFYVDKKPDFGNLHVSTLYYPAIPQYYQSRIGINIIIDKIKKSKKRWKRYYEVDVRFFNEKIYESEHNGGDKEKKMGDFENIADSKKRWDDSRTEKELTDKTAEFNKYLADHPHDVVKWMEFVQFQENFYSYNVLNYKAVSESSARDACRQKQLAIIEKALSHNSNNKELIDAKLALSRIMKSSAEYLSLLKDLIANQSDPTIIAQLWCAFTEGVFGSAAISSETSVRDSYTAAIVAMKRDQKAYVEMFYRYGLFLRQAGLLEQLHLLLDLVTTMNFKETDAFKRSPNEKITQREKLLADEENYLISSGLPTSVVWCRVEGARCVAHWLADSGEDVADPQRSPDATDIADLIAPVTRLAQLFTLAVHVLRLSHVPLLPLDHCATSLLRCLHPLVGSSPEWEADCSEDIISLLLEFHRPSEYRNIVARHATLPNYLQHGEYLSFVERLFASCLEWTSGHERLAVLLWWIRFQATVLALNTENRSEAVRARKVLQRSLKTHGDSPLAFAEFSRVEAAACGRARAAQVAVAALRSADRECRAHRMAIARCVNDVSGPKSAAGGWALACTALGRCLPHDLSETPSLEILQDAYDECVQRSDDLWTQAADDTQELEPIDCMLPSSDTEWWVCRYEILSRLKTDLAEEGRHLVALAGEMKTARQQRMHEAAASSLAAHAGSARPLLARELQRRHPRSARLAVAAAARPAMPALPPPKPSSALAAIASVLPLLLDCEESEHRTPTVGSGRRALAGLRAATAAGAAGARCPLLWRLRVEAEGRLDGGNAKTALYLALDACPACKHLYVEGARAAPSEFAELTDLLLEKQLRLHTLPEELEPI